MRRFFSKFLKWKPRSADVTNTLANIVNLKSRLPDIIEPDFGFLDELLGLGVLTDRQYEKVRGADKVAYERNEAVLELIVSEEQCDKFLKALQRTGQQHVVNYITQNGGQKH